MIDHRPALIDRCRGTADVRAAVGLAAEQRLLLSVRGGGHHIVGHCACDGGLMIDLSLMRLVRIEPGEHIARVGPGATLGDFDHEAQAFGLATPVGINSTTGIAGLTLGGGFGWLTRKHGMTVDNLRSAHVTTAEGRFIRASADENADLFWGIRGGGGNFSIVTSFEFDLHPLGPEVLGGLLVFPAEQAGEVLRQHGDFALSAPDEFCVFAVLRKAPPLPFLAEAVHGENVLILALFYAGDPAAGLAMVETLRAFGAPIGEHVGGAANRVSPDATAWPHRTTNFVLNAHGPWRDPADDASGISWARDLYDQLKPHALAAGYVNFMTGEEEKRISAAYGDNYPRLAKLKQRYDPENLFRLNHNIEPRASAQ